MHRIRAKPKHPNKIRKQHFKGITGEFGITLSRDQAMGGIIFIVCYPAIFYAAGSSQCHSPFVAFLVLMAIGTWIGWTMAIEETTSEIE